jgi:hypothetical protein
MSRKSDTEVLHELFDPHSTRYPGMAQSLQGKPYERIAEAINKLLPVDQQVTARQVRRYIETRRAAGDLVHQGKVGRPEDTRLTVITGLGGLCKELLTLTGLSTRQLYQWLKAIEGIKAKPKAERQGKAIEPALDEQDEEDRPKLGSESALRNAIGDDQPGPAVRQRPRPAALDQRCQLRLHLIAMPPPSLTFAMPTSPLTYQLILGGYEVCTGFVNFAFYELTLPATGENSKPRPGRPRCIPSDTPAMPVWASSGALRQLELPPGVLATFIDDIRSRMHLPLASVWLSDSVMASLPGGDDDLPDWIENADAQDGEHPQLSVVEFPSTVASCADDLRRKLCKVSDQHNGSHAKEEIGKLHDEIRTVLAAPVWSRSQSKKMSKEQKAERQREREALQKCVDDDGQPLPTAKALHLRRVSTTVVRLMGQLTPDPAQEKEGAPDGVTAAVGIPHAATDTTPDLPSAGSLPQEIGDAPGGVAQLG